MLPLDLLTFWVFVWLMNVVPGSLGFLVSAGFDGAVKLVFGFSVDICFSNCNLTSLKNCLVFLLDLILDPFPI